MTNQAAWLNAQSTPFKVGPADNYSPGENEVLVRNAAVAINPVDWKMQDTGLMIDGKYPRILGCDIAGEVVKVGTGVTKFKVGDRVISHLISLITQESKHSGFQRYTVAVANRVAKLPSSLSYVEGSVLPIAISTAADGLYSPKADGYLGLEYPKINSPPQTKVIVVYGASSSVGATAVQLASYSGVKVIAVASERNFGLLRDAGAGEVLDYKSTDVVDKIVAAVKATGLDFAGVYDAIAEKQSYKITIPVLEKLGGGNLATALQAPDKLPAGIKASQVFAPRSSTDPVWADFVGPALERGILKPLPKAKVVGKGLEFIEEAVDANRKGVSGVKIVVEL